MSADNSPGRSRTDWNRVNAQQDSDIDLIDSPELDEGFFKRAKLVLPAPKERITIRLSSGTLRFFKDKAARDGGRYQSWINAVLDEYVKSQRKKSA